MTKIIFAIYNPETDCVEVTIDDRIHISFDCKKCNSTVYFDDPDDIAYLLRLAREEPGSMPSLLLRMVGCKGMWKRWGSGIKTPPLTRLAFLQ